MRSKFTWIMTLLLAFSFGFSYAQEKTVTGVVSDKSGPLPNASVFVKGTQRSVQTDIDGNYSINVNVGDVLVFSYVSFADKSVTVGASNVINVVLEEDAIQLQGVTKDAYRTLTPRKSAVAITTITVEQIEDRANPSVLQNLQGQVAGLNIGTGSGQPGADSTILLRGVGSLNGNVEPLFVIDGIPVNEDDFRSFNQNDIATIDILKDASATSIYGNRGANGVVLITTKKGSYGEKLGFRYTSQFGFSELQPLRIELMNSRQILQFQKRGGSGLGSTLTDAEIDLLARQSNTYWSDIFFRKGVTKSHDLAISSGSANTRNYTSLGYFEQDGIFINTNLKRFSLRNNFNGRSNDEKFNYALNLTMNFSRQSGIDGAGSNQTYFAPFNAAMRGLPYISPYDANGNITLDGGITPGDDNAVLPQNAPLILLNASKLNRDVEDQIKMIAGFNADYNFAKNLTAAMQIGMDYSQFKYLELLHPNSILGPFQADGTNTTQFGGLQQEQSTRDFRFNSLFSLSYANTFAAKHNVSASVFVEYNKAHYDSMNFTQAGLDERVLGSGAAFIPGDTQERPDYYPYIPTIGAQKFEEGLFSYFANVDYSYEDVVGVTGTVRRDASFRFVDDNKLGTFFSVGGWYNLDTAPFMENSIVNRLKLRASFGTAGNQRILNAQYSALNFTRNLYNVTGASYDGTPGTVPSQIANTGLRWETTEQTNVGVDFGIWNNKLSGTVDVYRKLTTDLFQDRPISPINATSSIQDNIGTLENKGIEVQLNYTIYDQNDWNISVNANTSYNKNTIRDLPREFNGILNSQGGPTTYIEGQPAETFYLVRYAGVNPANGNPLFYTADGGITEDLSENDRVRTGKSIYPFWQGGFGTNVRYKGFEFSTQWAYVADIWRMNLDYAQLEETSVVGDAWNRTVTAADAWQEVGDITSVPRIGNPYNSIDYINQTDRYLEDASYLRLRNVLLGYTFQPKALESMGGFITGLRLFVQGENLVTFTSYRGWDAEAGFRTVDRGNFPTPKIYTLGAVINF